MRRVLLAAALALLLAAPAARADVLAPELPPGAPALAGDGTLVWTELARDGTIFVRARRADGGTTTVASLPLGPSPPRTRREVSLAATESRIVLVATDITDEDRYSTPGPSTLYTGPLAGPLERFGCGACAGRLMATANAFAFAEPPRVHRHDQPAAPARRFAFGPDRLLGLGGDLVAVAGLRDGVRIVDWTTGDERYRVDTPEDVTVAAVQPDGTVAIVQTPDTSSAGTYSLAVVTPDAPRPRALGVRSRFGIEAQIAAGTVAFAHQGVVGAVGVDGRLLGLVDAPERVSPISFDGRRVAWTEERCVRRYLVTWSPGEPQPVVPTAGCSAPLVSRYGLRVTRDGAISVGVLCPPTEINGCRGTVSADLRALPARGRPRPFRRFAVAHPYLAQGERARLTLGGDAAARRLLRRRRRVELRLLMDPQIWFARSPVRFVVG